MQPMGEWAKRRAVTAPDIPHVERYTSLNKQEKEMALAAAKGALQSCELSTIAQQLESSPVGQAKQLSAAI